MSAGDGNLQVLSSLSYPTKGEGSLRYQLHPPRSLVPGHHFEGIQRQVDTRCQSVTNVTIDKEEMTNERNILIATFIGKN